MMTIIKVGAGSAIITLVVFAIGLAIEQISPVERDLRETRLNVSYAIFYSFARAAAVTLLAGIPLIINALGGGLIKLPSGGWAVTLSITVYIVANDFTEYLYHRAQHAYPILWALHSLHHSDSAVNVTTTTRHHWLDAIIKGIAVYPIVGLVFAVPYQAVFAGALITYYNYFLHFNIRITFGPLGAVLNCPQYHRLHHSNMARHQNKNFAALFPVFDLLFGTYCRPAASEYPTTGIEGQRGPNRMVEAVGWGLLR